MINFINKFNLTKLTMELIKVSSRGQIVIPEGIRQKYGIKQGTKLILVEQKDSLLLKKEDFLERELVGDKDDYGWLVVAESTLKDVWDNAKDEKLWKRYVE